MQKAKSMLFAFFVKYVYVFAFYVACVKNKLLKSQLIKSSLLIKKKKTIKINICYTN